MKCPKCGGEMEEGFFADSFENLGKRKIQWGKKITKLGWGLDNAIDNITYRCNKCGFLESYAKEMVK